MRRILGIALFALLAIAGTILKQQPASQSHPPAQESITTTGTLPKPSSETRSAPSGQGTAKTVSTSRAGSGGPGYILALSWSPAFCASSDPDGESDQCEIGRKRGLVVHGLWPDGRREYCDTAEPRRLRDDVARSVTRYMPSLGLARHEWEKHGTCSGLSQRDYFATVERAWNAFRQPDILNRSGGEQRIDRNRLLDAIARANPGLPGGAITFQCGKAGMLKEIRLCLDGNLSGRACAADTRRSCPGTLTILPPR